MYTMISDNAHHTPTVEETSGKEVESVEPPTKKKIVWLIPQTQWIVFRRFNSRERI